LWHIRLEPNFEKKVLWCLAFLFTESLYSTFQPIFSSEKYPKAYATQVDLLSSSSSLSLSKVKFPRVWVLAKAYGDYISKTTISPENYHKNSQNCRSYTWIYEATSNACTTFLSDFICIKKSFGTTAINRENSFLNILTSKIFQRLLIEFSWSYLIKKVILLNY
jgi:hypothetical protein